MSLAVAVPRIFRRAWLRYGQPVMLAVRPIAQWSLPAGFAYDQTVDCVRNATGVVLDNPEDYWVTDTVYIVPNRSDRGMGEVAELQRVLAGGLVTGGGLGVWILGADIAKVEAAHALQLGGHWYDLDHIQDQPGGYPGTELWAYVRLRARL